MLDRIHLRVLPLIDPEKSMLEHSLLEQVVEPNSVVALTEEVEAVSRNQASVEAEVAEVFLVLTAQLEQLLAVMVPNYMPHLPRS